MKLVEAQVHLFRNIVDSSAVQIGPSVTCLVGKNESGKTAFLEALRRVKPAQGKVGFEIQKDYPAWRQKRDEQSGDLGKVRAVRAVFELDDVDRAAIEQQLGAGVLKSSMLSVEREYGGKRWFSYEADEAAALASLLSEVELPEAIGREVRHKKNFAQVQKLIAELTGRSDDEDSEVRQSAAAIQAVFEKALADNETFSAAIIEALDARMPHFFYFANYSELPASVKIRKLLAADPDDLGEDDRTALSLLRLAGTKNDYLLNPDYETRKRELENVANLLTDDVLQYWSQNQDLRVQIDITQKTIANQQGQPESVLEELKIRLYDQVHWLSLPFDQRSSGFRWFFSFLAAFSEYERGDLPVIILLDEPALALHARAQRDFLRFIEERISARHQVIYTTHSPFMIQPGELRRVRLVEDRGRDKGSTVTSDVMSTDRDTLFPLQGALGYDLVQHILIAPHNLVVEGTSDFTYLDVISNHLKANGRAGLDPRWSIKPVGGIDLIPSFVALLGDHLDLTVVVDSRRGGHQKLSRLSRNGYLSSTRIVAVGEILGQSDADIEDLFAEADYLRLYNEAFGKALEPADLQGGDTIIARICRRDAIENFDHGAPADVLLRRRDEILPVLLADTLARFERLFERINATLGA